jgi:competence protein ComGC
MIRCSRLFNKPHPNFLCYQSDPQNIHATLGSNVIEFCNLKSRKQPVRNSGMTFIGILFSLLIIVLLTITLIKNVGINTSDSKKVNAPMKKAKGVECTLKVDGLNKEISAYKITNEKFPASLDEITSDYLCPIFNVPYHYDPTSGRVWCPKHDQG